MNLSGFQDTAKCLHIPGASDFLLNKLDHIGLKFLGCDKNELKQIVGVLTLFDSGELTAGDVLDHINKITQSAIIKIWLSDYESKYSAKLLDQYCSMLYDLIYNNNDLRTQIQGIIHQENGFVIDFDEKYNYEGFCELVDDVCRYPQYSHRIYDILEDALGQNPVGLFSVSLVFDTLNLHYAKLRFCLLSHEEKVHECAIGYRFKDMAHIRSLVQILDQYAPKTLSYLSQQVDFIVSEDDK